MTQGERWIEESAVVLTARLEFFEESGDLTNVSNERLLELVELAAENLAGASAICDEHERQSPSTVWFFVSAGSGLGGLLLLEPTTASLIVTIGGALGGIKSLIDRGAHLIQEQQHLSAYWRADRHVSALASELIRRGIRF